MAYFPKLGWSERPRASSRLPPKVFDLWGQLGIAHRVLDCFVAEPRLQQRGSFAWALPRTCAAPDPSLPPHRAAALLERAGGCQPANRRGIDGVGPRHIGHRLARSKAL